MLAWLVEESQEPSGQRRQAQVIPSHPVNASGLEPASVAGALGAGEAAVDPRAWETGATVVSYCVGAGS